MRSRTGPPRDRADHTYKHDYTVVASNRIDRHDLDFVGDEVANDPGADATVCARHDEALDHGETRTEPAKSSARIV